MPSEPHAPISIKIRIPYGDLFAFGPGKADLLEAIDRCQSISAAGRSMGLSYTKTRRLLDELNNTFASPLVESTKGGVQGGGTTVTAAGRHVLATFRAMEARALEIVQEDARSILAQLRPLPPGNRQTRPRE